MAAAQTSPSSRFRSWSPAPPSPPIPAPRATRTGSSTATSAPRYARAQLLAHPFPRPRAPRERERVASSTTRSSTRRRGRTCRARSCRPCRSAPSTSCGSLPRQTSGRSTRTPPRATPSATRKRWRCDHPGRPARIPPPSRLSRPARCQANKVEHEALQTAAAEAELSEFLADLDLQAWEERIRSIGFSSVASMRASLKQGRWAFLGQLEVGRRVHPPTL